MSANSVSVQTLVFPDPRLYPASANNDFVAVDPAISFNFVETSGIRTLSTNDIAAGSDVVGLLYVPTIVETDSCYNASQMYVPANVTRLADLPSDSQNLIAIAPWLNADCTLKYLAAARQGPLNGFLFFLPNQGLNTPPLANDQLWDLNDGGNWKKENPYPVYGVPTATGQMLLEQSALYSGNMTAVPFGHNLTEQYDSRDYVRLEVDINTKNGNGLPSLWIFLLIILAILLVIIGIISLTMHMIQRKRRDNLRRRVAAGDVNLEALGIKRLTLPQNVLDEMPLYIYTDAEEVTPEPKIDHSTAPIAGAPTSAPANPEKSSVSSTLPLPAIDTTKRSRRTLNNFDQPTCPICLDDFIAGETRVRELPCRHIFHPECVDAFLRDNSSLCPLCKKSALPKGYCPAIITNAMVRRERMIRRIRPRTNLPPTTDDNVAPLDLSTLPPDEPNRRNRIYARLHRYGGRANAPTALGDVEMASPVPLASVTADGADVVPPITDMPPHPPASANSAARREWARRRALQMLGPRPAPAVGTGGLAEGVDAPVTRPLPRWRKWIAGVFPV